tara:strand:+ start:18014 stop:18178 length:165 start_codon:yes stop_codon:yes gene_type:complete
MRRVVYAESRKLRRSVNGYGDYVEPGSVEEVPVSLPAPQLEVRCQDAVGAGEVT